MYVILILPHAEEAVHAIDAVLRLQRADDEARLAALPPVVDVEGPHLVPREEGRQLLLRPRLVPANSLVPDGHVHRFAQVPDQFLGIPFLEGRNHARRHVLRKGKGQPHEEADKEQYDSFSHCPQH